MGNTFVYEVPTGTYEITHGYYRFYNGFSDDQQKLLLFSVKPGDAVYMGNFHANSLTMCLSNRDDFAKTVVDIKKAHPLKSDFHPERYKQRSNYLTGANGSATLASTTERGTKPRSLTS